MTCPRHVRIPREQRTRAIQFSLDQDSRGTQPALQSSRGWASCCVGHSNAGYVDTADDEKWERILAMFGTALGADR